MSFPFQKTLTTRYYDLDWNRHVTSRTYERFGYDARMEILAEIGYPIQKCLTEGIVYEPKSSFVRFLSQQFAGADINVTTELDIDENGLFLWKQELFGGDGKKACELESTSLLKQKGNILKPEVAEKKTFNESLALKPFSIHKKPESQHTLNHTYTIPFSDMNCFWNLTQEAIWKIFEEGRFLFFKEIVDFSLIQETDSTTFFMGGEIQVYELPEPGSNITIQSWIESVEKIRFYFRQDLVDSKGKVLASMKDEQLFVALSSSRPRKAPPEFLNKVIAFIETDS
ncbi:MAG: acyl-CoA thioesterase [Leptospira sp.]|nr:acyl-CoA thioesterase [Leptospira sp.]